MYYDDLRLQPCIHAELEAFVAGVVDIRTTEHLNPVHYKFGSNGNGDCYIR